MNHETDSDTSNQETVAMSPIWRNRRYLIVVLTPILLCPIPIAFSDSIGFTAYVLLLMAAYWMSEVLPIAVTALIPLGLFPLFGIMSASEVSVQYAQETNILVLSSLMVALAFEEWNLHKRLALRVLMAVGSKPRWLMFGFMMTTAFLSMWMINTATTAMMVPIAQAVLLQLNENDLENESENKTEDRSDMKESIDKGGDDTHDTGDQFDPEKGIELVKVTDANVYQDPNDTDNQLNNKDGYSKMIGPDENGISNYQNLCKGFMLCVPYAANIGGSATLIGSGPQQVLLGQVESLYGSNTGLNFATYMMYSFPGALICVLLSWVWLQWYFLPNERCCRKQKRTTIGSQVTEEFESPKQSRVARYIRQTYADLGPMSFAEKAVLIHAVLIVLLWFSRDPKFIPGWAFFFKEGYVKDSTVSMCIALLLFICPSKPPTSVFSFRKRSIPLTPVRPLLLWENVQKNMPWNVYFLMGGGFALAEGCKVSGLSKWLGQQFVALNGFPPGIIALLVTAVIAAGTEVTSNTATATIFLPILAKLSEGLGVNPLYLMIPGSVACAYAFMLPVATPPNAIAFSYGHLKVIDMAKAGLLLNITCILICNLSINTLGVWIFDVRTYPNWAGEDLTTTLTITANTTMCYVSAPC